MCILTENHMPRANNSLVIAIRPEGKANWAGLVVTLYSRVWEELGWSFGRDLSPHETVACGPVAES
jgi:hypothetical protein